MLRFFQHLEAYLCALIFLGMTVIGFLNVLVRYLSNYSFASTQELLLQGFLLLTVFGGALAARQGDHLAVTFFTDLLGKKAQPFIRVFADILSVGLLLIAAYYCYEMVVNQKQDGVLSSGLQIPVWYYSLALPFGFLLIALRLVQHTISVFRQTNKENRKSTATTEQPNEDFNGQP